MEHYFICECRKGDINKVKYYIDSGVDPSCDNNRAIVVASAYGHAEIVKLLLQDSRVNPASPNNYSIRCASEHGHIEVVKLLLNDKRVDPCDNNNAAIRWASKEGRYDVVKLLLNNSRVNPGDHNNEAIINASARGYYKIVELLLNERNEDGSPRVDPLGGEYHTAIHMASYYGEFDILKLLLQHPKMDPFIKSYDGLTALDYAIKRYEIIKKRNSNIKEQIIIDIINLLKRSMLIKIFHKLNKIVCMERIKKFLLKRVILRPNSVYVKRLVSNF
jgi:ankyrin repeat protein